MKHKNFKTLLKTCFVSNVILFQETYHKHHFHMMSGIHYMDVHP